MKLYKSEGNNKVKEKQQIKKPYPKTYMSDSLLTWRKSSRFRPLWGDFPPTFHVATNTLQNPDKKYQMWKPMSIYQGDRKTETINFLLILENIVITETTEHIDQQASEALCYL